MAEIIEIEAEDEPTRADDEAILAALALRRGGGADV